MYKKFIKIRCVSCRKENKIPVIKIYDGFEGEFSCALCGEYLDNLHDCLDD